MTDDRTVEIAMVIFPAMTNLDFAGPFEVLGKLPGTRCRVVAKTPELVLSDAGLRLLPSATFDEVERADVLFVPGGPGQVPLMDDADTLAFLSRIGTEARWVTSVCTGALLLGAAGLLRGYHAATHWMAMDQLAMFGAIPTNRRVMIDRNRVTGGGVTAGIDFGLVLAAELQGGGYARRVQLGLEYAPAPPFDCGHPDLAPPELVAELRERAGPRNAVRLAASKRAAARLDAAALDPSAQAGSVAA